MAKQNKKAWDCHREQYHGVQIVEAINESGGFGESLLEGVAEIVGGVGGDDEDRGSNPSEEDGEDWAARGLSHAAFPTDEDPLESLLIQHVLYRPFLYFLIWSHLSIDPQLSRALEWSV